MGKDRTQSPVEDAGASTDAAATAAAPDALETAGDDSGAAEILSEVVEAAEETIAEVREDLSEAEQVVMAWCNEHFSNSPVSRATEALNYLRKHAVPDLLKKIREI